MDKRKSETTIKSSTENLAKTGKETGIELSETELKKVAGGAINKIKLDKKY